MLPEKCIKLPRNIKLFFNRDRIFTMSERSKLNNNTFIYWLKEDGRKLKTIFLRQELFALKDQFVG